MRAIFLILVFGTRLAFADAAPNSTQEFDKVVQPFLNSHCVKCHGEKKHKGELRFDMLSRDIVGGGSVMHWGDVIDRINSGEMPPEDEPRPKIE
ncbi:MAG TPA: c-type cytochrome domain-containing protein, partial [Humisphaera sp.]|nr:c-type cytochrome domain-containing protein [Humisphaera sp.]